VLSVVFFISEYPPAGEAPDHNFSNQLSLRASLVLCAAAGSVIVAAITRLAPAISAAEAVVLPARRRKLPIQVI
jgi:hypothetical protein